MTRVHVPYVLTEDRPRRPATRQDSSILKYLTRFTDSGRYGNNVVSAPPSGAIRAVRPGHDIGEEERGLEGNDSNQDGLTSQYNRMGSPPETYEVPIQRRGAYEDVQPRSFDVPQTHVDNSKEDSGKYDYVVSEYSDREQRHYEVSHQDTRNGGGGGRSAPTKSAWSPGHYEADPALTAPRNIPSATPPSQHYAVSYAVPSFSQSKNFMEVNDCLFFCFFS